MFKNIPDADLKEMYEAAQAVAETMRVLQKSETNVVGEILKTTDAYKEWEHIPPDDVYDKNSHAQYYYHTHSKSKDGNTLHDDEHGHFHTFIRGRAMPEGMFPLALKDYDQNTDISDINTHLIGIGMNEYGVPIRLFTVNRWVTGETWYAADDVMKLLEHFEIDDTRPSWPLNLWISNMLAMYRPLIKNLIAERDEKIVQWTKDNPNSENIYEDRALEITSYQDIDLSSYVSALENEVQKRF